MAGKLSVQFELETSNAAKQGQAAGTAYGQSFSSSAKKEIEGWMSKLGPAARASMMSQLGLSASGNVILPPGIAPGPSGILKLLNLVQTQNIQSPFKGLRDVAGKDLARVLSMGAFGTPFKGLREVGGSDIAKVFALGDAASNFGTKIRGLRDVTGADLAKIAALPDINAYSKGSGKRLGLGILGAGASMFSPWIGARLLSDAAFTAPAKGGSGGLLGTGGAMGFGEFYVAIAAFKVTMEYVADMFKKVIENGYQLYIKSAQLHQSVGRLFAIQTAGQQVGLSQSQIDQFMLRNQWGKARTSLQNFGVFSNLGGLSKEFKDSYQWANEISGQWQLTAKTSYDIGVQFDRIKMDWLTMWNDSGFLNTLDKLLKMTDSFLHFSNVQGFSIPRMLMSALLPPGLQFFLPWFTGKVPPAGDSKSPLYQLKQTLPVMVAWEKMGFVIGGGRAKTQAEMLLEKANMHLQTIANAVTRRPITATPPYTGASGSNLNPP